MTYTPYVANLGFDPDARAEEVAPIYCSGDLARHRGADAPARRHLPAGQRPAADCATPTEFAEGPELHKVFENAALRIWQLNGT